MDAVFVKDSYAIKVEDLLDNNIQHVSLERPILMP